MNFWRNPGNPGKGVSLLQGLGILSEEQVDKQTKQIVNQCNNNRAMCVFNFSFFPLNWQLPHLATF